MSGGFIGEQSQYGHQVVIFTFKGNITPALQKKWNEAINDLKRQFGDNVLAVTLSGQPTPSEYQARKGAGGTAGGGRRAVTKRAIRRRG